MKPKDNLAREQALDTKYSFIVQAPAGSGKTEILTQRFLSLLGNAVSNPEEIVAITFTRKAAAEMRHRIIRAIESAQYEKPEEPHKITTWTLAKSVLEKDSHYQWHILENPNRLKITTIDAFCRNIAGQLPVLSHLGSQTNICDKPYQLYHKAAQQTLKHLSKDDPWQQALSELLISVDNDYERAENLIVSMLSTREQWLNYIGLPKDYAIKQLTQSLENIVLGIIENIFELIIDIIDEDSLIKIVRFAAANKGLSLQDYTHFPEPTSEHFDFWQFVATLFVTQKGELRKNVDKRLGFPVASAAKNKEEKIIFSEMKSLMKSLLTTLIDHHELIALFNELQHMPTLNYYQDATKKEKIFSLFSVIELAYAELRLLFGRTNQVDFTEISLSANSALQNTNTIAEINLILDYKLKHILIDEFQDTSRLQFSLLESLTREWLPEDGKTLFLVGDPMQSIYRFRQAEVGLFIQVQKLNINNINIKPLYLLCNFRSDGAIIDWVNQQFKNAFPHKSDIATGAIHYSPSTPIHHTSNDKNIHWHIHNHQSTDLERAITLFKTIQPILQNSPESTIAILARKRKHLLTIIQVLNAFRVPYQAIDIESLMEKPLIHDLIALTAALTHLGDKLSWLSILRMPAIGLSLADLLIIADSTNDKTIFQILNESQVVGELSSDGQKIIKRIMPILNLVIKERDRYSYRQLIAHTFTVLGGLDTLISPNELSQYNSFLNILDTWDNEIIDYQTLRSALAHKYVITQQNHAKLQLMTIHKSKGLEFDYVFLPELQDKGQIDTANILAWHEQPTHHHSKKHQYDWLLAPKKAIGDESDKMYQLIRKINQDKSFYEMTRLFYVAVTRAKKALHLSYQQLPEDKPSPPKDSLLYAVWNTHLTLNCQYHFYDEVKAVINNEQQTTYQVLPPDWTMNPNYIINDSNDEKGNCNFVFDFSWEIDQKIGSIYHILFKFLSDNLQIIANQPNLLENKINYLLETHFIPDEYLDNYRQEISTTLHAICKCQKGRWILEQHTDAKNEYPISLVEKNTIKHYIIDRTFIDENGVRWIVDYKITALTDDDIENFEHIAWEQHHHQLVTYARYFEKTEDREIKLALYYPKQQLWFERAYQSTLCL